MAAGQERVLRRRIKSVNSTRKITRAMELIAASRIAKAQQAIAAARPYVRGMISLLEGLSENFEARKHPIFTQPEEVRGACVIVVAADRGLCGPYNSNVLRTCERLLASHEKAGRSRRLVLVGKRGQSYFRFRGFDTTDSFIGMTDKPTHADASIVARRVVELMGEVDVDLVQIVYTRFVSAGSQVVTTEQIYPVERAGIGELSPEQAAEEYARHEVAGEHHVGGTGKATFVDYEFEPDADVLLDRLVPRVIETRIYGAMLDASASEHASRQRAMKAATDNADELAKTLTRLMNRARQDSITTEISEIVGGAEALNQAG